MSIFDNIARAFGPKATKSPTVPALERLLRESSEDLEAARVALEILEAGRVHAVLEGEAARIALRAKVAAAREDLAELEIARDAVAARLEQTKLEEAEKARRVAYERAEAAQKSAVADLLSRYEPTIAELRKMQEAVAAADRLAEAANADLPQGAARLLETEAVRDVQAVPEQIIHEELVDAWFTTESGNPVEAAQVTRREGRRGVVYAESAFGPRPVPCELRRVRKVTRQPWCAPVYGARIGDLELPALHAEPGTAPKPIQELVPITEVAEAAE
ncbi:hypothetical protein V5F79_00195 [Xanthobacter flavus]|uniref:hypothetical protein n=1 Tax=Xanthobacter flavus TaxID=281 RepID=UPI00372739B2